MTLEISHYNSYYTLKGALDKSNLKTFIKHFAGIFERNDAITLNIESLESIDRTGVMALAKLHNESITKQKKLSIIGLGCKDLYEHFKSENSAA
ncbi:MAG: hypothetical protein HKP45_01805 [Winogradskyella sp.]|nr:hypothetical protein [Winogradskyella sp.]MBT8375412.1 hypothetical protein [Bacteroidia bacterium]NNF85009.1 hypothetical protein [Winogradskyella sp.]NNK39368.1 hypothetical protein [Winogradskyella sp.]